MSDQEINTSKDDFVSQTLSYLTSKKGMYMIVGIILIGCICYYKFNQDKKEKDLKPETQNSEPVENKENIHQPPPGYVTVPIEMVQQMQQQLNYQEHLLSQQQGQQPPVSNQPQKEIPQEAPPQLRHNKQLEDDDSDIIGQNLSKNDMESIQAQLNAMQNKA
jgi:hypothetical protein